MALGLWQKIKIDMAENGPLRRLMSTFVATAMHC